MFKIILTAMDSNAGVDPYTEEIGGLFETYDKAEIYMLYAMHEELSSLSEPDEHNTPHTRVFISDLDGDHDAIIRLWDGDDYWDVSYYDIVEVEDGIRKEDIEREALYKDVSSLEVVAYKSGNEDFDNGVMFILEKLDALPTADVVEVRHGEWRETCVPDVFQCTSCKRPTKMDELCDSEILRAHCPNCGAETEKELKDDPIHNWDYVPEKYRTNKDGYPVDGKDEGE